MPDTMQDCPVYKDVVSEAASELTGSIDAFLQAGVDKGRIIADPGFGFAKDANHNVALLRGLDRFISMTGYPALAGLSRKSFIGALTGKPPEGRLPGTLAATAIAYRHGVKMFRVHDVKETVDFLKVLANAG
jgi:dihydropteroate synthase